MPCDPSHPAKQVCTFVERRLLALPHHQFTLLPCTKVKAVMIDLSSPVTVSGALNSIIPTLKGCGYTATDKQITARAWVMASGLMRACDSLCDRAVGERIIREVLHCPRTLAASLWDCLQDTAALGGLVPSSLAHSHAITLEHLPPSYNYRDTLWYLITTIATFVEESLQGPLNHIPFDLAREDADDAAVSPFRRSGAQGAPHSPPPPPTQAAAAALPPGVSLPAPNATHQEYSNAANEEYDTLLEAAELAQMNANFITEMAGGKVDDIDEQELDVPVPKGLSLALHPVPFGNLCSELLQDRSCMITLDYQAKHLLQVAAERFMETVYKAGLERGSGDTVVRDGIAAMCARNGPGCACCAPKRNRAPKRARNHY